MYKIADNKNNSNFKHNFLLYGLAAVLLFCGLSMYWLNATTGNNFDFFTIWIVPQTLKLEKVQNIYSIEGQKQLAMTIKQKGNRLHLNYKEKRFLNNIINFYRGRIDTVSTPFLYMITYLLTPDNYNLTKILFTLFSILSFFLSFILLCILLKVKLLDSILLMAFLSGFFTPIFADLNIGGIGQIQFLIVTLFIFAFCFRYSFTALISGFILGLGIALKPNILLVFPVIVLCLIIDLRFRKILFFIIGIVISLAAGYLLPVFYFSDQSIWFSFTKNLIMRLNYYYPLEHGNLSLSNLAHHYFKLDISFILTAAFFIILLIILIISRKKQESASSEANDSSFISKNERALEVALLTFIGCGIVLISAQLSWTHYYVILALGIIALLGSENCDWKSIAIKLFACLSILMIMSTNGTLFLFNPNMQSIIMNSAAFLLIAASYFQLFLTRKSL